MANEDIRDRDDLRDEDGNLEIPEIVSACGTCGWVGVDYTDTCPECGDTAFIMGDSEINIA